MSKMDFNSPVSGVTPTEVAKHLRKGFKIREDRELLGVQVRISVPKSMEQFNASGPKDKIDMKDVVSIPVDLNVPLIEMLRLISHEMECLMAIYKDISNMPTRAVIEFIFEAEEKGVAPQKLGAPLQEYVLTAMQIALTEKLLGLLGSRDEEEG